MLREKEFMLTDKHKQFQKQITNEKKKAEHLQEAATRIKVRKRERAFQQIKNCFEIRVCFNFFSLCFD